MASNNGNRRTITIYRNGQAYTSTIDTRDGYKPYAEKSAEAQDAGWTPTGDDAQWRSPQQQARWDAYVQQHAGVMRAQQIYARKLEQQQFQNAHRQSQYRRQGVIDRSRQMAAERPEQMARWLRMDADAYERKANDAQNSTRYDRFGRDTGYLGEDAGEYAAQQSLAKEYQSRADAARAQSREVSAYGEQYRRQQQEAARAEQIAEDPAAWMRWAQQQSRAARQRWESRGTDGAYNGITDGIGGGGAQTAADNAAYEEHQRQLKEADDIYRQAYAALREQEAAGRTPVQSSGDAPSAHYRTVNGQSGEPQPRIIGSRAEGNAGTAAITGQRAEAYMSDEQRQTYNYLYATQGEGAAEEYYKLIEPELEQARTQGTQQEFTELSERAPAAMTLLSTLASPAKIAAGLTSVGDALAGDEINTNSAFYTPVHAISAIRQTVPQVTNWTGDKQIFGQDADSFIYGVITSSLDSALNMALATGLGGIAGGAAGLTEEATNSLIANATSALMGAEMLPDTIIEEKAKGRTDEEATAIAIIRSLIEGVTEKYSIEYFLGDPTTFGKKLGKAFLAEGSEEVASNWLNNIVDVVSSDPENVLQQWRDRVDSGENGALAFAEVVGGMLSEDAASFIAGGISGLGMGAVHEGISRAAQDRQASRLGALGQSDAQAVVDEALAINPDSKAAQRAKARLDAGKGVRSVQLGRIMAESDAAILPQEQALAEASQKYGKQAGAMQATYDGEQDVQRYDEAYHVAYEMGRAGTNLKAAQTSMATGYLSQEQRQAAWEAGRDSVGAGSAADIANGRALLGGQIAAVQSISERDGKVYAEILQGTETKRVALEDLKMDAGTKMLAESAKQYGAAAPTIFEQYRKGQQLTQYLRSADMAVSVGMASPSASSKIVLDNLKSGQLGKVMAAEQIEALYKAGQQAGKAQLRKTGMTRLGTGSFMLEDSAKGTKLDKRQRASLRFLRDLSRVTGLDISVYKSTSGADGTLMGANGSYVGGRIRIDLNAGAIYEGKLEDASMLRTAAHELTHFMAETAETEFKELQSFLVEKLSAWEGHSIQDLVEEKMAVAKSHGRNISPEVALEEVVADGCEMMLRDSKAIRQLAEENRTLFEKVRDWMARFFESLRKAFEGVEAVHPESIHMMENYAEELQKLWDEALTAAVKNAHSASESIGIDIDAQSDSVAPAVMNSERTWTASDYVQERETAAREIAKAIGVSVRKAKDYIDSINSIAKMIAEDRTRLDYFSSPGRSSFVGNVEYGGSFDFSTLCKKRRLLTGTFSEIQKALPNTALTANEILDIRNRMKEKGLEVNCGLCYVEGSRANMGKFAKEFLNLYKKYYPDAWQPNMADVNTPDGIEWVRLNHPECYEQYEYFWNHYGTLRAEDKTQFASQQKPKLYQLHTEYKGEILDKFKSDGNVEAKNRNGGIRLQSFSDFEIVHLIDTMQIIMDMSRVGLAGQAYTKVPDFAWALGDTGLKINLSLIAKDVDADGRLVFDEVEGMPIDQAMALRDRYSADVGTILVVFNDQQLIAAMADDRVDFIIPFHRSQWKKAQYSAMGLPARTKDYTYQQNEKYIKPQYHEYRGRMVRDKASNYMPNEYWDFNKSGKENAIAYLEMCAENNKRPKFYKLLQDNGDGSYSLKPDGSTDGYWKLLIDFKMYDNSGKGSPQMPVQPRFNMDEATRMLNDYRGGHNNFPVAHGVVDEFVRDYKESHPGMKFSDRAPLTTEQAGAEKRFGTTTDFNEAGFILPDGKMLRFTDDANAGARNYDHRAIGMVYGVDVDLTKNHGFNMESNRHMNRFVEDGGIRFDPGDPDYDMGAGMQLSKSKPLTKAQERTIRDFIAWKQERDAAYVPPDEFAEYMGAQAPVPLTIEFGGGADIAVDARSRDLAAWNVPHLTYEGGQINADRVIADIRHYYETGEVRKPSEVARFRYSERYDGELLSEKEYRRLMTKNPVKVSKQEYAMLRSQAMSRYAGMQESDIPDIDIFRIGDYRTTNRAFEYYVRNRGSDTHAIVKRKKISGGIHQSITEGRSNGNTGANDEAGTRTVSEGRGRGSGRGSTVPYGYGRTDTADVRGTGQSGETASEFRSGEGTADLGSVKRQERDTVSAEIATLQRDIRQMQAELRKLKGTDAQDLTRVAQYDAKEALKAARQDTKVARAEGVYIGKMEQGRAMAKQMSRMEAQKNAQIARLEQRIAETQKRMNNRIAEQRQRLKDYRENRNESEAKQHQRKQVEKQLDALAKMLTTNNDKLHVPKWLKQPVKEMLEAIMPMRYSKSMVEADKATKADLNLARAMEKIRKVVTDNDRMGAFGYLDLPPEFFSDIDYITDFVSDSATWPLYAMTSAQLKRLNQALTTLVHSIRQTNQLITAGHFQSVAAASEASVKELKSMSERKLHFGLDSAAGKAEDVLRNFLSWKNTTPYYAFRRFGEGGQDMFRRLADGWDRLAFNSKAIMDFAENTYTEKEVKAWEKEKHTVTLDSGEVITLSTANAMEFYELSKRQQALGHLLGGGIRVANQRSTPAVLTTNDIDTIIKLLTERQREVADKLQEYMELQGSEWGNEVSMKRFGYRYFTEQNYYPVVSDSNELIAKNAAAQENSMYRLLNLSMTKGLQEGANNAIVIGSIFDTFANHMSDMAKYNALALPILDTMKWFNYRLTSKNEAGQLRSRNVRQSIEAAYGSDALAYFTTFMEDLNGANSGGRPRGESFANKMTSNMKVASVAANLRVAGLQATSIARAATVISPKYLLMAQRYVPQAVWHGSGAVFRGRENGLTGEMLQYSGIARWKSLGFFDTNVGRNIQSQIKNAANLKEKVVEKSMSLAELGDTATWTVLWGACKMEQKAKGFTGQELLQKTAERFRDVIYATQVVDSTMTRSHMMRSKNGTVKNLTPFMSEPTLTYNVLLDAAMRIQEVNRKGGNGWKTQSGHLFRAFTAFAMTSALSAIIESLSEAARDDDDDPFLDKFLDALLGEKGIDGNLVQDMVPIGNLPYLNDAVSILQGYSSERMETTWMSKLYNVIQIAKETEQLNNGTLDGPTKITSFGSMTEWGKLYKVLDALSTTVGLPIAAFSREVTSIWNATIGAISPRMKIKRYENKDQKFEWLYTFAQSGSTADYEKELAGLRKVYGVGGKKTEDEITENIQSGMREKIQAHFLDGDISAEEAQKLLEQYGGKKSRDAADMLETWQMQKETGIAYDDMREAFVDGDLSEKDAVSYLVEYGGKRESEAKATVLQWQMEKDTGVSYDGMKNAFVDGEISEKEAVSYLVKYGGKRESEAANTVREWSLARDTGTQYDDLRVSFVDGDITEDEATSYLIEYGGKSKNEAADTVRGWQMEKDTGIKYDEMSALYVDGELSKSDAKKYLSKYGGKNEEEVEKTILQWQMEKDTGIKYDEMKELYLSGDLSERQAISYRAKYTYNSDEDKATETVTAWRYEKDYGVTISGSRAVKYYDSVKPTGVRHDVYEKALEDISELTADYDDEGKAISGSKKQKIVDYILSLGLTWDQQKAIWDAVKGTSKDKDTPWA